MKSRYKLTKRKARSIQVSFAHTPGSWFSTGTRDMTEAVLWAEKKLEEDLGIRSRTKNSTFKSFALDFFSPQDPQGFRLRSEKRNHLFQDTYYQSHEGRLENYLIPKFGNFLLSAINDVMIEDWFVELTSYRYPDKELSDDSKNKILECLRIILQEAKRQGYIDENPAQKVQMINAVNNHRSPFTEIELFQMFPRDEAELIKIWKTRMWATYFLIMRDTGFRPGEVSGLTLGCFSEQYQGIYTEQSIDYKTRKVKKRIKTTGKGKGYKVGLLTKQTIKQLKFHIEESSIVNNDGLLFLLNNRPIIPETANKHLKLSLKRTSVNLNNRTQYSFRHSFETHLAGNIDQNILLELMAHTNYRPEYDHRTPEDILAQMQPALKVIEARS